MTYDPKRPTFIPGRFTGAGPWPDGVYYVWDKDKHSICNPDTGDSTIPYRRCATPYEVTISAKLLNERWKDRQAWEREIAQRDEERRRAHWLEAMLTGL